MAPVTGSSLRKPPVPEGGLSIAEAAGGSDDQDRRSRIGRGGCRHIVEVHEQDVRA